MKSIFSHNYSLLASKES